MRSDARATCRALGPARAQEGEDTRADPAGGAASLPRARLRGRRRSSRSPKQRRSRRAPSSATSRRRKMSFSTTCSIRRSSRRSKRSRPDLSPIQALRATFRDVFERLSAEELAQQRRAGNAVPLGPGVAGCLDGGACGRAPHARRAHGRAHGSPGGRFCGAQLCRGRCWNDVGRDAPRGREPVDRHFRRSGARFRAPGGWPAAVTSQSRLRHICSRARQSSHLSQEERPRQSVLLTLARPPPDASRDHPEAGVFDDVDGPSRDSRRSLGSFRTVLSRPLGPLFRCRPPAKKPLNSIGHQSRLQRRDCSSHAPAMLLARTAD